MILQSKKLLKLRGFLFYFHTFASMNNKNSILGFVFGAFILLALLLQSFHSTSHLVTLLSEKECHHKYHLNKTEFGHAHHDFDHCFVCEFTFSTSLKSDFFSFDFQKTDFFSSYSISLSKEIIHHFEGSLFALRAPPYFIA